MCFTTGSRCQPGELRPTGPTSGAGFSGAQCYRSNRLDGVLQEMNTCRCSHHPAETGPGDLLRVIATSSSGTMVTEHVHSKLIESRFSDMGLRLSYGRHVDERNVFDSSSVASRATDLHEAFANPEVKGVLTVIGGFNSNELLPYLDRPLIAAVPQIVCGYPYISALQNAIFTDWPCDLCRAALVLRAVSRSHHRRNLCSLNLLRGTAHVPALTGAVLMLEDDTSTDPLTFAWDLPPASAVCRGRQPRPGARQVTVLELHHPRASAGNRFPALAGRITGPGQRGLRALPTAAGHAHRWACQADGGCSRRRE